MKKHATLKTTPADAASIADRALSPLEIVDMIEAAEAHKGSGLSDYRPSPKRQEPPQVLSTP